MAEFEEDAMRYNKVKLKYDTEKKVNDDLPTFGKRHIQVLILFISLSIAISMRTHFSVTIVAMTDHKTSVDFRSNITELVNNTSYLLKTVNETDKYINGHKIEINSSEYGNLMINKEQYEGEEIKSYHNISSGKLLKSNNDTIHMVFEDSFSKALNNDSKVKEDLHVENRTAFRYSSEKNPGKTRHINNWSVFTVYEWPKSTQELVTGAFFVGYTSMQIPMGIIAQRYGGKKPILVGLLVNAVMSIITPWAAVIGWWAVSGCRVLQGMTQAAFYPGCHTILGKWAPASERGRLSSYIYSGSQFGTILGFQIAGFLAGTPAFGWPVTFWTCGMLSFACFVLFYLFGAASPAEHSTISPAEKQYIMGHDDEKKYEAKRTTPWKSIMKSMPVWAMIISHAGSGFGYIFLMIEIPVYMNHILHVNIKDNGLFSSLPYLAMYLMAIFCGHFSDYVINKGFVSIINARRIFNSCGMVLFALLMVAFSYAKSVPLAVALLIMALASHSGAHVGFVINQIDLAPNFAGTLMSLGNLVANFVGLGVPVLVSLIVKDVENQSQWQIVFWITSAFLIITNTVFVIFLKVDIQPWNDETDGDRNSDDYQYEKINKVIYVTSEQRDTTKEDESKL